MNADEIIRMFEAAGGQRRLTCYDIPEGLEFQECCGSRTAEYNCHEFIARGPNGGGPYYLNHNLEGPNRNLITFGVKGFHYEGSEPCI